MNGDKTQPAGWDHTGCNFTGFIGEGEPCPICTGEVAPGDLEQLAEERERLAEERRALLALGVPAAQLAEVQTDPNAPVFPSVGLRLTLIEQSGRALPLIVTAVNHTSGEVIVAHERQVRHDA